MVGFVYVIHKRKAYLPIRSLGYKSIYLAGAIIFVNTTKVLTGLWRRKNLLNSRNTKNASKRDEGGEGRKAAYKHLNEASPTQQDQKKKTISNHWTEHKKKKKEKKSIETFDWRPTWDTG